MADERERGSRVSIKENRSCSEISERFRTPKFRLSGAGVKRPGVYQIHPAVYVGPEWLVQSARGDWDSRENISG